MQAHFHGNVVRYELEDATKSFSAATYDMQYGDYVVPDLKC